MTVIPQFTASNLKRTCPTLANQHPYVRTTAKRIQGPFIVLRAESHDYCADGWLAVDEHGEPYAIPAP